MKKIICVWTVLLLIATSSYAQPSWNVTNSTRGNFAFGMPGTPNGMDTLNLLSYMYAANDSSNISYHVEFIDSASISGNQELEELFGSRASVAFASDPCYVDSIAKMLDMYAEVFQSTTQGTIEGYEQSDYIACSIRGRALTIRHQNLSGDGDYYFTFTRYFYWNSKLLIFTITGPESNLPALYAYKNQFFSSIYIF
ncbi:MAG: hypothetical protein ACJ751_05925 [Niastella sp.]|uniref:hypothetical protein n=1 Tax=Niastella sp. TaxID=1869183 RepID=UPI00389A8EF9